MTASITAIPFSLLSLPKNLDDKGMRQPVSRVECSSMISKES